MWVTKPRDDLYIENWDVGKNYFEICRTTVELMRDLHWFTLVCIMALVSDIMLLIFWP